MNGIFKIDKYNIRLTYFMNMRFIGELNKKTSSLPRILCIL